MSKYREILDRKEGEHVWVFWYSACGISPKQKINGKHLIFCEKLKKKALIRTSLSTNGPKKVNHKKTKKVAGGQGLRSSSEGRSKFFRPGCFLHRKGR